MDVYLNGDLVPPAEARIGHDDAGFQHAVGLFETMAATHGRAFRLEAHIERLQASAAELGLVRDLEADGLIRAVERTLAHNGLDRARIRLTVTAGEISLLRPADTDIEPTVLVVASEPTEYDPRYFTDGITAVVAGPFANPFDPLSGHKTLSYWSRLRLLRQAAAVKAGETVVLNVSNHLAGGAISNLFLVRNGTLLTPIAHGEEEPGALAAPVRPGVTRAAVIELAARHDCAVERRMLDINDLLEADEVFLTNSSWHVLPVTRIEKSEVGEGRVGPLTTKLRESLLGLIEDETSGAEAN